MRASRIAGTGRYLPVKVLTNDELAERVGGIGEIVIRIMTSLLGAAWAVITVFVVPGMVYKGLGPIEGIKHSVVTLKKTWGESLIRVIGLGLAQLVFIILGAVLFLGLLFLGIIFGGIWGAVAAVTLAVLYFVAVIVFFNLANAIFNTALYHYAETGKVPMGYDKETMDGAFAQQERK